MSDTAQKSGLTRAHDLARESIQILLDYTKIASDVHEPDRFFPAFTAMQHLTEAMIVIEDLQRGHGRTTIYSGGVSADT